MGNVVRIHTRCYDKDEWLAMTTWNMMVCAMMKMQSEPRIFQIWDISTNCRKESFAGAGSVNRPADTADQRP